MRIAVGSEHTLVTCARSKTTMGLLEGSLGARRAAVAAQTSSTHNPTRTVPARGAPGTGGWAGPGGGGGGGGAELPFVFNTAILVSLFTFSIHPSNCFCFSQFLFPMHLSGVTEMVDQPLNL